MVFFFNVVSQNFRKKDSFFLGGKKGSFFSHGYRKKKRYAVTAWSFLLNVNKLLFFCLFSNILWHNIRKKNYNLSSSINGWPLRQKCTETWIEWLVGSMICLSKLIMIRQLSVSFNNFSLFQNLYCSLAWLFSSLYLHWRSLLKNAKSNWMTQNQDWSSSCIAGMVSSV